MLNFLAVGNWSEADVTTHVTSRTARPIVPEVDSLIDQTWRAAHQTRDIYLFDGPLYRLECFRAAPERLDLTLSPTSYRTFYGTNLHHPELIDRYGAEILANPVGVSPTLISADGFLLLGRRNARVAYYPNRLHPFSGALDPDDIRGNDADGRPNPFNTVRRELREELHLDESKLAEIRCLGLVEDQQIRQPELIFAVHTTKTREEIEQTVDPAEHGGSVAIAATAESIGLALASPQAFTPVAVASWLLWGRLEFGDLWARQHLPAGSIPWYS